jgi:large subunit ribosomal protein L20
MTRVKGATHAIKKRRSILKRAKGFRFGRSTKERQAKEAVIHAGVHAFNHRRDRKADFRRLWQIRINAAVRPLGLSYSRFIDALKKKDILLDRKVLSGIAQENPETFERIVEKIK